MQYELMFPADIRQAIAERWPVVWPLGVLEYHADHACVGVDTLLVVRAVQALEKEMKMVVLPAYYYGAASYVVAPPEGNGTVHIRPEIIQPFAKSLFDNLLRIGFRNVHGFIHHQSENFTAGMPTDLAFKGAGRQAIFDFLERERGEGWWGKEEMRDYYTARQSGGDPFSWIRIHPFMSAEVQRRYPIDHSGKQETSLMLAFCPEGVDTQRISAKHWFCESAREASLAYGEAARRDILADMRQVLGQ